MIIILNYNVAKLLLVVKENFDDGRRVGLLLEDMMMKAEEQVAALQSVDEVKSSLKESCSQDLTFMQTIFHRWPEI